MEAILRRGANVSLQKLCSNPDAIQVGVGWIAPGDRRIDASALLLTAQRRVRDAKDLIFCNQLCDQNMSIMLMLPQPGAGQGPASTIGFFAQLSRVPVEIETVAFMININPACEGTFKDIQLQTFLFGCELGPQGPLLKLLARYDVIELEEERAVIMAELYRHRGEWKFRAVGQGFNGGLSALAESFGVTGLSFQRIETP